MTVSKPTIPGIKRAVLSPNYKLVNLAAVPDIGAAIQAAIDDTSNGIIELGGVGTFTLNRLIDIDRKLHLIVPPGMTLTLPTDVTTLNVAAALANGKDPTAARYVGGMFNINADDVTLELYGAFNPQSLALRDASNPIEGVNTLQTVMVFSKACNRLKVFGRWSCADAYQVMWLANCNDCTISGGTATPETDSPPAPLNELNQQSNFFELENCRRFVAEDCQITGAEEGLFDLNNGNRDITFRRCRWINCGGSSNEINGSEGITFEDCYSNSPRLFTWSTPSGVHYGTQSPSDPIDTPNPGHSLRMIRQVLDTRGTVQGNANFNMWDHPARLKRAHIDVTVIVPTTYTGIITARKLEQSHLQIRIPRATPGLKTLVLQNIVNCDVLASVSYISTSATRRAIEIEPTCADLRLRQCDVEIISGTAARAIVLLDQDNTNWSGERLGRIDVTRLTASGVASGAEIVVLADRGSGLAVDTTDQLTWDRVRETGSDPLDATAGNRPTARRVGEQCFHDGKLYVCTNATTPTWVVVGTQT